MLWMVDQSTQFGHENTEECCLHFWKLNQSSPMRQTIIWLSTMYLIVMLLEYMYNKHSYIFFFCERVKTGRKFLVSVCVCMWERKRGSSHRTTLGNQVSWRKIQAVFLPKLLKIPVRMRAGGPVEAGGLCCWYGSRAKAAFSPVLSFNSWHTAPE